MAVLWHELQCLLEAKNEMLRLVDLRAQFEELLFLFLNSPLDITPCTHSLPPRVSVDIQMALAQCHS